MCARGVEVHIGYRIFFAFEQNGQQNLFRRSSLMNGLYVLETENFFCVFYQMQIAARARVGFVAHHDARPLRAAHGVGAAVRQKVDINVLGLQREHVVIRFFQSLLTLFSRENFQRFHAFDSERLGNVLHHNSLSPCRNSSRFNLAAVSVYIILPFSPRKKVFG